MPLMALLFHVMAMAQHLDTEYMQDLTPGQSEYAERAERLLASAVEAGDELSTAHAQHALAKHMKSLGLFPQALTHAELARDTARRIDDAQARLAIDITYASIQAQLDRTAEATEVLLASLEQARLLDDSEQEQEALLGLSAAYIHARQLEEAADFAHQGLELARAGDNRVQQVRFLNNLGLIAWTGGDAETAAAYIESAMSVGSADLPPDVRSTLVLASITLAGTTGQDNAMRARELIDEARRDGSRYIEGFASEQLGQIMCESGAYDEGLEDFASADSLFRDTDRLGDLRRLHERWAACLESAGRFEAALEKQRESMAFLDQVHERRRSETLQAHDIAFRTEQRVSKLARLAEEEQALQTRVARQRALTGWLTAAALMLLGVLAGFWIRNRRLREHRDAQAALQQARVDLLARTSHEIRNPAQGIIGILESRQADGEGWVGDQGMATALAAARMVGHLANDYLDLALVEQGRLRVRTDTPICLPALIERVKTLSQSFIASSTQRLVSTTAATIPDWIYADGDRLIQVLLNLVSNAARYAGPGDICLHVSAGQNKDTLIIDVTDDGPGLDASDATLFNPYVCGSSTRGSGLGLAISARIVNAMGGRINAGNRSSGGACLSVELPLRVAARPALESSAIRPDQLHPEVTGKDKRVLIIDDDRFARLGLTTLVESLGGKVCELASGVGLESTLDSFDPQIVLTDHFLEDSDGLELAGRIRQFDRGNSRARTVIVVSGTARPHGGLESVAVDGWLTKPVGRSAIQALISQRL